MGYNIRQISKDITMPLIIHYYLLRYSEHQAQIFPR